MLCLLVFFSVTLFLFILETLTLAVIVWMVCYSTGGGCRLVKPYRRLCVLLIHVCSVSSRLTVDDVSGYDTRKNPGYARCATVGVLE